jgi:phytanoyl-CoA hydroxylase
MPQYLSSDQIHTFHQDGFLVIRQFIDTDEAQILLERAKQLLADFNIEDHPKTKFTTGDDDHIGDDYFLNSGDKIHYFLEEGAIDADGKLNRLKENAVNKIGHGLHELDPAFRKVTLENERLRQLVRDLKFHKDPVGKSSSVNIHTLRFSMYTLIGWIGIKHFNQW